LGLIVRRLKIEKRCDMKRIFLLIVVFAAVNLSLKSQEHVPEQGDYQNFMKSKTLVLLEKNPMSDFNMAIRKVMENSWTLTDYQFINDAEFEAYRNNPSYSFLMITKASFDRDRTKARYNFLSLLMAERAAKVRDMPDLCSLPLAYEQVEDDSFSYKLEAFIRFMQNHVQLMLNDPSLINNNPYLTKEDLANEIDTEREIRDIYPHPFKIVTREEVAQAIADKREDVVFLHKVGPEKTRIRARVYKMLVGAGDPHFYYFDYTMMKVAQDDAFQEKDLKKIR
jgi:hypothetical protein